MSASVDERWRAMGADALAAARSCLMSGRFRSAISRAYYSVHALATGALIRARNEPREPWGMWSHLDLPLAANHGLRKMLGPEQARMLGSALRCCYRARLGADHDPAAAVGKAEAIASVTLAHRVARVVEQQIWPR